MTVGDAAIGLAIGVTAGLLSGLVGIGGGTVMTPGIQVLMGASPIIALATPLPAIVPTAATGAWTYRRGGEVDLRAAVMMAGAGIAGAIGGAALTDVVDTDLLLFATAVILGYQAIGILRGSERQTASERPIPPVMFAATGLAAGFVSGLLGVGGGIVMVPILAGLLGMPLKRTLGTSLATIVVLAVPGTIVHTALGHIDWAIFAVLTIGAVPGARLGASLALRTRTSVLRVLVGGFLLTVAIAYGASEAVAVFRG